MTVNKSRYLERCPFLYAGPMIVCNAFALENPRGLKPAARNQEARNALVPLDRPRARWACRIAGSLALMCLAAGCVSRTRSFQPTVDPNTLDDVSFLHYCATVPVVTVDEGLRAVLMLSDIGTAGGDFEVRFQSAERIGAVKKAWALAPDHVLDKGTLAHMLRTVCRLRRSLGEMLASAWGWGDRRTALASCVHAGLMPYSTAHEPVTGGELLSALTAAERFLSPDGRGGP